MLYKLVMKSTYSRYCITGYSDLSITIFDSTFESKNLFVKRIQASWGKTSYRTAEQSSIAMACLGNLTSLSASNSQSEP